MSNRHVIIDLRKDDPEPERVDLRGDDAGLEHDVARGVEAIFTHERHVKEGRYKKENSMSTPVGLAGTKLDDLEAELVGLEVDHKHTKDPALRRRLEAAIGTYRRTLAERLRPDHAEAIRKAEIAANTRSSGATGVTERKVEELRKSDPSLTEAQAWRDAARDPEAQKAYLAERVDAIQVR